MSWGRSWPASACEVSPPSTAHLALPARPAPRRATPSLTGSICACSADVQLAAAMDGSEFNAWERAQMHPMGPRSVLMFAACMLARDVALLDVSAWPAVRMRRLAVMLS